MQGAAPSQDTGKRSKVNTTQTQDESTATPGSHPQPPALPSGGHPQPITMS